MRLIFMGTPEFAVPSLRALVHAGHEVLAVYTQPDRPAGRGQKLQQSPVKQAALELGLTVQQPRRVREEETVATLFVSAPDAMVVVGYGQIIPKSILDIPPLGIVNVHASLLPRYRGAAPIQWALANGETETGVTTMRIDEGLDTGDILLKAACPVHPDETALTLWNRLADMGANLLVETMEGLAKGTLTPQPQNDAEATYAPILKREDGQVNWSASARVIYNRFRGFQPWPGAWTWFRGARFQIKELKIFREGSAAPPPSGSMQASTNDTPTPPGTILVEGKQLRVHCGDGSIVELLRVQADGKAAVAADTFLNGARLEPGERFTMGPDA
jgi:methionyl-tRNA formyltransferase